MAEDLPEGLFRNAIDLNRFSNGVSRKLIESYNRIILRSVAELKRIEAMPSSSQPKARARRLRALLAQTEASLQTWSTKSVNELAGELEGIAQLQSKFAKEQLSKALSPSARELVSVRSVEVSPEFAKAVVTADPLAVSTNILGESLEQSIKGPGVPFKLTAKQGAKVRMPSGESITKMFRGLATKNAQQFAKVVQDGLLTGEPTEQLARQLVGNLEFGQKAKSARQFAQAGGELTKLANHQVMSITRTSVNQVANTASQQVYMANPDLTSKYRYVATLDARTSPVCRDLDGQEFEYGKGPMPPQHFGCRSTTVPVIDYEKIQEKYPNVKPPSKPLGKRAAAGGSVPSNTTYSQWLYEQRAKTKKGNLSQFEPGTRQIQTLGKEKAKYFNRLAKKYGPNEAMKKFMREDGSEVTLATLKKRYGEPSSIKPTKVKKIAPKPTPKVAKVPAKPTLKPTPKVAKPPVKPVSKKGFPSGTDGKPIPLKPVPKVVPKVAPKKKPVAVTENKHIRRLNKLSDQDVIDDYKMLRSELEFKQVQAEVVIAKGRIGKVGPKSIAAGEKNFKETTEALKLLDKRHETAVANWRAKNLPQVSGSPKSIKKLEDKELTKTLNKYNKELSIREKRLDPKEKFYNLKLERIREQQSDIADIKARMKKGLSPTDWEAEIHTPMGYIYDRQGFNGKPSRVKTVEDLQKSKDLMKGGDGKPLVLYRGVEDKQFADQFKGLGPDGGQHYPGVGIFGNGTYAASRQFYSTGAQAQKSTSRAIQTARTYSGTDIKKEARPLVTAFGIKKDAKILRWPKGSDTTDGANPLWMEWEQSIHEEAQKLTGLVPRTTGEAAAALGYDGYQVPEAGWDQDYWVIFNRNALVVAEDPPF